jgi:hypothetical protein
MKSRREVFINKESKFFARKKMEECRDHAGHASMPVCFLLAKTS